MEKKLIINVLWESFKEIYKLLNKTTIQIRILYLKEKI